MIRSERGFTLVELIVTMVILGVLSAMTSKFVADGMTFYVEANTVRRVNADLNFLTLKLRKLYENSVPNSLKINYDRTRITFVPVSSAFGFFYVPKDETGGFDQNERVLYAVKSPFFSLATSSYSPYLAFSSSDGDVYYKVTKLEDLDSSNLYKFTLENAGSFAPLSETRRMYLVDPEKRYASVCFNGETETVRLYYHETADDDDDDYNCETNGAVIAENVSDVQFSRVDGSYNPYGELEILYTFRYPNMEVDDGRIVQRIGVRNAP